MMDESVNQYNCSGLLGQEAGKQHASSLAPVFSVMGEVSLLKNHKLFCFLGYGLKDENC